MKKLAALLAVLVLAGMVTVRAKGNEESITVYAQVPSNWSAPCLWAWSGDKNAFDAWPGKAMTDCGDGWYSIDVGSWIDSVIVNGNGGTIQTADLAVERGCDVYVRVVSVADVSVTYEKPTTEETAPADTEASFTQPFSTEEEVAAYLTYCLNSSLTEFRFTCDAALYEKLSADSFAELTRLELRNGIGDASVRYSAGKYLFDFSEVKYEVQPWAECADEAGVRRAMADLSAGQPKKFVLFVSPDLCSSLYIGDQVNAFGARCGMAGLSARYDLSGGIVRVSDVSYAESFACAADRDDLLSALEFMAHKEAESFYVALEPDLFDSLMKDRNALDHTIALSPIESCSCVQDSARLSLDFSKVVYSDVPRIECNTEEDIVQAIRNMGAAGSGSFNLILSGELYDTVYDGYFQRLQQLEAEAGMTSTDMSYDFAAHVLYFSNAVIRTDVKMLASFADANSYVEAQSAANADEITLFCTEELYNELLDGFNPYITITSSGMVPLYDVAAQAGLFDYGIRFSDVTHIIVLTNIRYYPGTNILRCAESGIYDSLSSREDETRRAAEELAASCAGETPLDTARNIHDALIGMIEYTDDETTEEDDTAIGALLNGEANCDGYSDAFCLVGSLAGLEVRCQHGDSYRIGFDSDFMNQITHMWNLIKIDGTWRLVDVTWDDGSGYTWFNLGYDRASRMHIWNEQATVELDPVTDLSCRPANEFTVSGAKEAAAAVESAAKNGFSEFSIIYTDEAAAAGHADLLNIISGRASGSFTYFWNERMLMLSVQGVCLKAH